MARLASLLLLSGLALIVGCASKSERPAKADVSAGRAGGGQVQERVLGLPEGWEMMPAGVTRFSANQTPTDVTLRASGDLPAANYEAKLFTSPLRIWPPQYLLARRKTGEVGAQVITPFDVSESFKAKQPVRFVVVSDEGGAHRVPVDPPRE